MVVRGEKPRRRFEREVSCRETQVPGERLDELKLPPMYHNNEDPKQTAFTVSTDYKHGTTTGISAADRALTFRALADPTTVPEDFNRPGHVFPLRPREVDCTPSAPQPLTRQIARQLTSRAPSVAGGRY